MVAASQNNEICTKDITNKYTLRDDRKNLAVRAATIWMLNLARFETNCEKMRLS